VTSIYILVTIAHEQSNKELVAVEEKDDGGGKDNEYILNAAKQVMLHFSPTASKLNEIEISLIENMMSLDI
jgi:hypothetical protein